MANATPQPLSIGEALTRVRFWPDRSPTAEAPAEPAFERLAAYRDGAVFVGDWAGHSEWERHSVADEIVMVLDGAATIFFLADDGSETSAPVRTGELVIVPQGTWHRFEVADRVKLLSVTPQPTDHVAVTPPPAD